MAGSEYYDEDNYSANFAARGFEVQHQQDAEAFQKAMADFEEESKLIQQLELVEALPYNVAEAVIQLLSVGNNDTNVADALTTAQWHIQRELNRI